MGQDKNKKKDAEKKKDLEKKKPSFKQRLVRLAAKVVLLLALVLMGWYWQTLKSAKPDQGWGGTAPWTWSADEWKGFASFSWTKAKEAKAEAQRRLPENWPKTWDDLKTAMSDTGKIIEQKIADLRGKKDLAKTATAETPVAAVEDVEKTAYFKGLEQYKVALDFYQNADAKDKGALEEAEEKFGSARSLFETAATDEKERPEGVSEGDVEEHLQECQSYILDCHKRRAI